MTVGKAVLGTRVPAELFLGKGVLTHVRAEDECGMLCHPKACYQTSSSSARPQGAVPSVSQPLVVRWHANSKKGPPPSANHSDF
ncbi:hypothetical protein MJG53_005330 [Ovis ammon polii x Ovis aries]|uniref:Uncharacterized protein n=1 Tax=Ovis ammon polii x Ovis aries TaxID=2918886 RepID=A0ACB9VD33_9CETA|nr:hypothetical protein MJG53_005330 [Ovis ammon polii x Ovis aries]